MSLFDLVDPLYSAGLVILVVLSAVVAFQTERRWVQNSSLVLASLFFSFAALECALRLGFRADDSVWIPKKSRDFDYQLALEHFQQAKKHPFGFNDRVVEFSKLPQERRVAVLGDSFVYGDGLHNEDRWSVRFEKLLRVRHPDLQVLHWGRNGWSTFDEFNFLKQYGGALGVDLLLVGFVTNDVAQTIN